MNPASGLGAQAGHSQCTPAPLHVRTASRIWVRSGRFPNVNVVAQISPATVFRTVLMSSD